MNNSCNSNNNCSTQPTRTGNGFVIIIVLYILLAIIIGSYLY